MGGEVYRGKKVTQAVIDELKLLLLERDERLLCVVKGVVTKREEGPGARPEAMSGFLVVTSKRVVFHVPKMFGRYEQLVFHYDRISSVKCHGSLRGDRLGIAVDSRYTLIEDMPAGDGEVAARIIQDLVGDTKSRSSPPNPRCR